MKQVLNYKNRRRREQECIKCLMSRSSCIYQQFAFNIFSSEVGISQLKWECLHRQICCVHKTAVCTVFIQPLVFKLGTQTFKQHTLCQHNILPVYTVWTLTVF